VVARATKLGHEIQLAKGRASSGQVVYEAVAAAAGRKEASSMQQMASRGS
jgi:hypothetical protein